MDALRVAQAADRAGADTIWISEDLYFHGALTLAGSIAATTHTSRIGFSVLTPYGIHVGRVAMEIATLAELAPDRLIAGIGAGVRARIELMHEQWTNPVERVKAYTDSLQILLAGGTIDSAQPTAPARGLALSLERPPGRVPLYVAASGPKALFQAGKLFDGVLLSLMASAPHIRTARGLVDDGAASVGQAPPPVIASLPIRVNDDIDAAISDGAALVGYFMTRWASIPSLRALFVGDGLLNDRQFARIVDSLHRGSAPRHVIPKAVTLAHCPSGTASQVVRQLVDLSNIGIDGFNLDPGPMGNSKDTHNTLEGILSLIRAEESDPVANKEKN